jgi:hypothetical protein
MGVTLARGSAVGARGRRVAGAFPRGLGHKMLSHTVSLAMRPPLVVIHLHRQEDADCVARALAALPAVDAKVEGRDVSVDMRSLGDVLNALHQCLVENDMTLVHIKIDDRTYAMEPATDGRELGFERCQPRLAVASNQAGATSCGGAHSRTRGWAGPCGSCRQGPRRGWARVSL